MILPKMAAWVRQLVALAAHDVSASEPFVFSSDLPGPPAVALARRLSRSLSDVEIAPLETEFEMRGHDLLVRARFIVDAGHLPSDLRAVNAPICRARQWLQAAAVELCVDAARAGAYVGA